MRRRRGQQGKRARPTLAEKCKKIPENNEKVDGLSSWDAQKVNESNFATKCMGSVF